MFISGFKKPKNQFGYFAFYKKYRCPRNPLFTILSGYFFAKPICFFWFLKTGILKPKNQFAFLGF